MKLNYVLIETESELIDNLFNENKTLVAKDKDGQYIKMRPEAKLSKLRELFEKKGVIKIPLRLPTAQITNIIEHYKLEKDRLTLSERLVRKEELTLPAPRDLRDTTELIAAIENLDPKFLIDEPTLKVDGKIFVKQADVADLVEKAKTTIENTLQAKYDVKRLKYQIEELENSSNSVGRKSEECINELTDLKTDHNNLQMENLRLNQEMEHMRNEKSSELANALAEAELWKSKLMEQKASKPCDSDIEFPDDKPAHNRNILSPTDNGRQKGFEDFMNQDDAPWTNTFLDEKPRPRMNVNNLKVSLKIPIWENSPSIDKTSSLNDYIDKLKMFKSMNVLTDAETIYSSLEASNRVDILRELDKETMRNIDKFVTYLRMAHGGSSLKQRNNLESLMQFPLESALSFFKRVIREYYLSKGLEPKDPLDIKEKDRQEDIVYYFSKGLRNNTTGTQIRMNRLSTNFHKLGEMANHIDQAIEPMHTINNTELIEKLNNLSINEGQHNINAFDRYPNQNRNKNRQCWTCGFYGHTSRECFANTRTQGRYSRQVQNRSRDRDPRNNRNRSPHQRGYNNRGRSPYQRTDNYERRDNTPYRRGRSDSRGSYRGRSSSNDRHRRDSKGYRSRRPSGSRDRRNSGSRDRNYSKTNRSSSRESRSKW